MSAVLDKRRLARRAKKMMDESVKARKLAREALEDEIADLNTQIDGLSAQISELRNHKATQGARLEQVKVDREVLRGRVAELQAELDGTAELARVRDRLARTKTQFARESASRRRAFRATAKTQFRKTMSAADLGVKHSDDWKTSQPHKLIERPFAPLGPSDPSLGVVSWTRFDYKPDKAWMVEAPPLYFSYLSTLGGGGDAKARRTADAGPRLPAPPSLVEHALPWRAAPSGGQRQFSAYAKDPQPGVMERASRRRADVLARRDYKPEKDGKAPWHPADTVVRPFSTFDPDAKWVNQQETKRVDMLMTKFGLTNGGTGEMPEFDDDEAV